MSEHISWSVELAIKPGHGDAFRELTDEMVAYAHGEPGVTIYERFISDDEETVFIYERFVDANAATSHLLAFKDRFGERFAQLIERRRFTVFGSPDGPLKQILDDFGVVYASQIAGFSREPPTGPGS